jgi:hypothetical protein
LCISIACVIHQLDDAASRFQIIEKLQKDANGVSTTTMLEYRTEGFQGYAVKYSPFFDNRLAVAAAANFGLVGNGRLYVLELTEQGIRAVKW